MRAWVVPTIGSTTGAEPVFGVESASTYGYVWPLSTERLIRQPLSAQVIRRGPTVQVKRPRHPLLPSGLVSASAASAAEPQRRIRPRLVYGVAAVLLLVAAALSLGDVGEKAGRLSDWQAFVLGVTQGLTELLPISSSGHLILVPWIADWHYLEAHPDFNKTFDVALHLGTLVAVVAYFWNDVTLYVGAWFRSVSHRSIRTTDERIAWWIFAATVPAAIVGALGESTIENHLGQPWQIAIFMSVFAVLLWVADRSLQQRRVETLGFWPAFWIGTSQILALMPGVSRSGITITTGRFLRLERDAAARFAFLLLIPIVFGAVVYKGLKDVVLNPLPAGSVGPFVVGTMAAAAVGLIAIDLLLGYVRRHDYTIFVIYRLVLAALIVIVIASGWRSAHF
jgi:undecaprenyl-diphosphatase